MDLTEIYKQGEEFFRTKEYGLLLDYVETAFVRENDRQVIDRFTFRQKSVDAPDVSTTCRVLGVELSTPVIMSAMTMPIPAIAEDALMQLARGLKTAGSLMWTGTPIPDNLAEIASTGVPLVANVKPLTDRDKVHATLDKVIEDGVIWVGIEIDAGRGTKIRDREMGFDCTPFSLKDIEVIKKRASVPLVCKGVLSAEDAKKCIEAGVDIVVVSNHGGHTLDYLPHPFQVMDEIVDIARGKAEIIVDGGFRRGSDVLKGLAFGASLVGLGRPILYALAAGGENGITDLIGGLTRELARLMCMVGVREPVNVPKEILIAQ
ncbi:MAG TPA: alpha-hydroxy acid oxidase [Desulfomonilaceae bacterium]|nr:alpha-hydroxy acid oxidase [Desulfomonilaceae bacterium]